MKLLSRDEILQADDLSHEDVAVPEWGGVVRVRTMTGAERSHFEQSIVENPGRNAKMNLANVREKLVALCLIDAEGNRLFDEKDIKALGQKSAAALARIFDVAQRLNGLTDADVEELAENFSATPNGASTSA